jgi:propionate CoA-transferase
MMGLRDDMLRQPLSKRLDYDPEQNIFFLNFEGLAVRSSADIERIRERVETTLRPIGRKVYAVVNYDHFSINPELIDEYCAMVSRVVEQFYSGVTRYTSSSFLKTKLGNALNRRALAPHIYENAEQARARLKEMSAPR